MFYSNYPQLDLHGVDRIYAKILVNEFIEDCLIQKQYNCLIIHGRGMGIVKKSVHEALKVNKHVKEYKLDNFNIGCTVVQLKEGE